VLSDRRVLLRRLTVLVAVAAAAVVIVLVLPAPSRSQGRAQTGSRPAPQTGAALPATTAAPAPSATPAPSAAPTGLRATTTSGPVRTTPPPTVDPGTLPQTGQLPGAGDALLSAHVQDLWQAVVDGRPDEALPFFFPLHAYIQVKGISDPVHDYQTRLIPNFEQDVHALHTELGAAASSARLTGISVPDAAQWIRPGVEYNKGSYWRVYGTTVNYMEGGTGRSFPITSLISWRGEWYVVHLGAIR
jgi:hypothetical protein